MHLVPARGVHPCERRTMPVLRMRVSILHPGGRARRRSPLVTPMTPNVEDALALARAIGRADREAVDVLLDDLGITSSEKAASLVGYLCGLLIGLAQLHAARTGESWEDLLTQFGKVAISEE